MSENQHTLDFETPIVRAEEELLELRAAMEKGD